MYIDDVFVEIAHLADISEYVLPPAHLRQYPYITPNQLPIRTIKEIIGELEPERDKKIRRAMDDLFV